jgi:hypothetical protein
MLLIGKPSGNRGIYTMAMFNNQRVYIYGYPQKWMVYNGKSNKWIGGTPISGNLHRMENQWYT